MISVIIPTLNEETALPVTLDHLLSKQGDYEVIVTDGGSTDNTCSIASADDRIQLINAAKGRARQMNAGAQKAKGEWLLFLHADTQLPEGALTKLNALETSSKIQAGGFRQRFSGDTFGLRVVSWLHNFRCQRTHVFYGDQAMFVRKELFWQLGGFPDEPVLEDLLLGEKLAKATTPVLMDEYVITDSRKFEQKGVWLSLLRVLMIQICHELHLPIPAQKFFAEVR